MNHCTVLSPVAAPCPELSEGRSFLKERKGRSCVPGSCRGGEANGAMKGTVILSHPFVLLDEVHQTTGISKRQAKAVSNLHHPRPSSCSIPCCYPPYAGRESTDSKKSTPKCRCRTAHCGSGPSSHQFSCCTHHPRPSQQAKAFGHTTTGPWKEITLSLPTPIWRRENPG